MKKILKLGLIYAILLAALFPAAASAIAVDTNYVALTDIPGLQGATASNPGGVLKSLFNLAIGLGSILAVIMIIIAGFKYMYEESIFGKGKAKEQITNALFGLLLILGSYVILKTINGDLLRINLLLPKSDGKLGVLVANNTMLKDIQTMLHNEAVASAARTQAVLDLKKETMAADEKIKSAQAQIDELKKKPITDENSKAIASLETQIKTQEQTKAEKTSLLNSKTLENLTLTSNQIVTTARQNLFLQEIDSVSKTLKDDPVKTSLEARTSIQKLAANTDSQMSAVAKRVEEASALTLSGDAAKQRDAFVLKGQQDVAYLSTSKNMLVDLSGSIDTTGLTGVKKQSEQFDQIIKNYSEQVAGFESTGRKDLANQLQNDIAGATKLMKLRQANNCASKTPTERASITLCKQ